MLSPTPLFQNWFESCIPVSENCKNIFKFCQMCSPLSSLLSNKNTVLILNLIKLILLLLYSKIQSMYYPEEFHWVQCIFSLEFSLAQASVSRTDSSPVHLSSLNQKSNIPSPPEAVGGITSSLGLCSHLDNEHRLHRGPEEQPVQATMAPQFCTSILLKPKKLHFLKLELTIPSSEVSSQHCSGQWQKMSLSSK